MPDLHRKVADLDAEIDALSDAAQQCRKSMVAAKLGIERCILLLVASLRGLIRPDAIVLLVGIAAALAGTVFYQSSRSSLENVAETTRVHEVRRVKIIDRMDPIAVGDQRKWVEWPGPTLPVRL